MAVVDGLVALDEPSPLVGHGHVEVAHWRLVFGSLHGVLLTLRELGSSTAGQLSSSAARPPGAFRLGPASHNRPGVVYHTPTMRGESEDNPLITFQ